MEQKKTHTEVKEPQISVQGLADYMGAKSERAKRSVVQSCRYRANVRVIQHNDAKLVCANYIRKGGSIAGLIERANDIRNKLADSDFDVSVNEHNADYIERFAETVGFLKLPKEAEQVERGKDFPKIEINGVKISMRANLLFRRKTKTNKLKVGALMLRYSKGKPLPSMVGANQAAAIFGFLRYSGDDELGAEPEKALCLTVDVFTGSLYAAPSGSVDIWNDMKAACATIAERWPNIPPPSGAVL